MSFRAGNKQRQISRHLTISVALLALFVHAFIVSATHFHRARQQSVTATPHAFVKADGQTNERATDMRGHGECLLCRLQRDFISDLQTSLPSVMQPPPQAPGWHTLPGQAPARLPLHAPSGRAPPLA